MSSTVQPGMMVMFCVNGLPSPVVICSMICESVIERESVYSPACTFCPRP